MVPITAACSYFAMAVGQGAIVLPLGTPETIGRLFYYARYVDCTFTTPLLLSLCCTAMHSGLRRGGLIAGLLLANCVMILTALFFGLSEVAWIKWTWFLVSCAAFLAGSVWHFEREDAGPEPLEALARGGLPVALPVLLHPGPTAALPRGHRASPACPRRWRARCRSPC